MPPDSASPSSSRFVRAGVIASVVLVFALTIAAVTLWLRGEMHAQIQQREAESIAAAVALQLDQGAQALPPDTPVSEVPGMLLVTVLDTTQRLRVAGATRGNLEHEPDTGLRVFDADAKLKGYFPFEWSGTPPPADTWAALKRGESVGRLHANTSAEEILDLARDPAPAPAFEAWVPLRRSGSGTLLGAAQFIMNGSGVAAQVHKHDQRLITLAALAWIGGSIAIVFALSWAFQRLDAANYELRARTEDLERANRELVLAAKTSALGAVTAHLIHELKNPIAGLEMLVGGQAAPANGEAPGGELAAASELTRRLRGMVNDVVGVLRDEQTGAKFELSGGEIAEVAVGKVRQDAEQNGVKLQLVATGDMSFPARRANLATLVLRNLLQNALEASTTGGTVKITTRNDGKGGAEFLVEDYGRGLPPEIQARIFQPCASTKVGGSGLGLALSHQLAQRAGGKLEVVRSNEFGTCFRLVLLAEA
jgi:signal transduction histidine kinase